MAWQDRAYNSESGPVRPRLVFPMPSWLTLGLIVACLVVFILQAATGSVSAGGSPLITWGAFTFSGYRAFTQPWRWVTYQYLHSGGAHIFWNLISLYFIVPFVERAWGWKRTLLFYTCGGVAAGIVAGIMSLALGRGLLLVGASGSILSLVGAAAVIAPDTQILAMMIFPITMRTLAILYTIFYLLTILGDRNVSDAAHLGGLVFGVVAPYFGGPAWARTQRRWQRRRVTRDVGRAKAEQDAVDRILAKVSEKGMHSLTRAERRTLKLATEHQRKRDVELAQAKQRRY